MKYFGTVNSFDVHNGRGSISPESGGDKLNFERSAIAWDAKRLLRLPDSASPMTLGPTVRRIPAR